MLPTSDFAPFIELVLDVQRKISICGNERGEMFLASEEFVGDILESWESHKLQVYHIPEMVTTWRLPAPVTDLLRDSSEILEIKTYVLHFNGGVFVMRAGFSRERMIWLLSGEAVWISPLELELRRNELI